MKNRSFLSLVVGLALVLCMMPSMAFAAEKYSCYVENQGTIGVEATLSNNVTFSVNPEETIVFYEGMNIVEPGSEKFKRLASELSYEWCVVGEEDTVLCDSISYTHEATQDDLDGKEYVCRVSFNGKYGGKLYYVACSRKIEFNGTRFPFYDEQYYKDFAGEQIELSTPAVSADGLQYEWWKYDREKDEYVELPEDSSTLPTSYGDFIDYYTCYIFGDDTNYLTADFVLISCKEVKIGQSIKISYNDKTRFGYGSCGFKPDVTGIYPINLDRGKNTDVKIRIEDFDGNNVAFRVKKDINDKVSKVFALLEANKKYEIIFDTNGPLKAIIGDKLNVSSTDSGSLTPKCETCGGSGIVYDSECELCEGSGYCLTCNGDGCCNQCGGSGECDCKSVRYHWSGCEYCGYTGNCPVCGGSRACEICQGSGFCSCMHSCPDCGGLGVIIITTTSFDAPIELLTAKTSGNNSVKLSWNKIDGATKYEVYGQQCGKKYKKIATTTKASYTVKKISGKRLKAHKAYKFYVKAITSNGTVKSKNIHFITGSTMGKYANAKSISVNKKSISLEQGDTVKIKVTTKVYKDKKHLSKKHGAATRYISEDPSVATVNSNGVVTAKSAGIANIYIQDIGGKYCKTKVTTRS